jgi:hypothetical protein
MHSNLKAFVSARYSITYIQQAIASVAATSSMGLTIQVANNFVYATYRALFLCKTSITHRVLEVLAAQSRFILSVTSNTTTIY